MFHLCGWYQSLDPGGNYTSIDALTDERIFTEGDNIRIPEGMNMLMGLAGMFTSATEPDYYLYSPTLQTMGNLYSSMANVDTTNLGSGSVINLMEDFSMEPITLGIDELVRAYTNANPAASGAQCVLMWLGDGRPASVPTGRRITIKGSFTAPSSAGVWSPRNPTWTTELPPGMYGVIGMNVIANTTLACRLNFRTGDQWRPGVIAKQSPEVLPPMMNKAGKWGLWGRFDFTQFPQVDILARAAATGDVYLDIVQLQAYT